MIAIEGATHIAVSEADLERFISMAHTKLGTRLRDFVAERRGTLMDGDKITITLTVYIKLADGKLMPVEAGW